MYELMDQAQVTCWVNSRLSRGAACDLDFVQKGPAASTCLLLLLCGARERPDRSIYIIHSWSRPIGLEFACRASSSPCCCGGVSSPHSARILWLSATRSAARVELSLARAHAHGELSRPDPTRPTARDQQHTRTHHDRGAGGGVRGGDF